VSSCGLPHIIVFSRSAVEKRRTTSQDVAGTDSVKTLADNVQEKVGLERP
jgi:hypothetical protein